jgi:HEPN domain-containing protein
MPQTDSTLPNDWFEMGDMDLQAARILMTQGGPFPIVAFHLHQTIEKYLKGYLLSAGWPLRRIHDLEMLIQQAIAYDHDFVPYLESCQEITEFYIETRYPVGARSPLPSSVLAKSLNVAEELVARIRRKVSAQDLG